MSFSRILLNCCSCALQLKPPSDPLVGHPPSSLSFSQKAKSKTPISFKTPDFPANVPLQNPMIFRAFTCFLFQILLHVTPSLQMDVYFGGAECLKLAPGEMLPRTLPGNSPSNPRAVGRHHQEPASDGDRRYMASPRRDRRLLWQAGPNAGWACGVGIFP